MTTPCPEDSNFFPPFVKEGESVSREEEEEEEEEDSNFFFSESLPLRSPNSSSCRLLFQCPANPLPSPYSSFHRFQQQRENHQLYHHQQQRLQQTLLPDPARGGRFRIDSIDNRKCAKAETVKELSARAPPEVSPSDGSRDLKSTLTTTASTLETAEKDGAVRRSVAGVRRRRRTSCGRRCAMIRFSGGMVVPGGHSIRVRQCGVPLQPGRHLVMIRRAEQRSRRE